MDLGEASYMDVGFLRDLLDPWIDSLGSDEWADFLTALFNATEFGMSANDYGRVLILERWIVEELDRAFEEDWWDTKYDYNDWAGIYYAQDQFEQVIEDWRITAGSSTVDRAGLEQLIARLPFWVRPQPNRLEKPDRERAEYERLKAKFEGTS